MFNIVEQNCSFLDYNFVNRLSLRYLTYKTPFCKA